MVLCFGDVVALLVGFVAQGVGTEGFQRRSGGLAEGSIEFLDTGKGFPQFGAHARRDLVERVKHVLLVRRGRFFAGDIVAAGSVLGVEDFSVSFPRLGAMLPVRIALTPSRSPISRAICGVMVSSCLRPRY